MNTKGRYGRLLLTGHSGLAGSALERRLQCIPEFQVCTADRASLDLTDARSVCQWFAAEEPDVVIHAAGRVGGIVANARQAVEFLHDNLAMGMTVLRAAHQFGVRKLLMLGSSCIYPRDCSQPIREKYLGTGPLEATNEACAIAKIACVKACDFYRAEYGCSFISAMPTNLYGPNDNCHPESSHVLPGLIRRFQEG